VRYAILAPGESMDRALADSLKHLPRIVVTRAYELAPGAEALVANDQNWWNEHKDALAFAGRKFSTNPAQRTPIERVPKTPLIQTATNSGLLAVHVAITLYGATRVELYGFDMRGSHYFGVYKNLPNTKPERFEVFKSQFERYAQALPPGVEVINCTPGSALLCFPFQS
jgi:hypothetical protein